MPHNYDNISQQKDIELLDIHSIQDTMTQQQQHVKNKKTKYCAFQEVISCKNLSWKLKPFA